MHAYRQSKKRGVLRAAKLIVLMPPAPAQPGQKGNRAEAAVTSRHRDGECSCISRAVAAALKVRPESAQIRPDVTSIKCNLP